MPKIKVYPTHESVFHVAHPIDGHISDEGSMWEHDAFTARMLNDNAVSRDEARRHVFAQKRPDPSRPPAHATGTGVAAADVQPVADQSN